MKVERLLNELSNQDVVSLERELDALFIDLGLDVEFSKHFKNRVIPHGEEGRNPYDHSDARESDVTKEEIVQMFRQLKDRYGKRLLAARSKPDEFTAILKDISTDLNIPMAIDRKKMHKKLRDLNLITIMRKKGFVSNNRQEPILKVKTGANV